MNLPSSSSTQAAVILIIDADPLYQRAIRGQLIRLGFTVRSADDFEAAEAIMDATPPDLVLLAEQTAHGEDWDGLQVLLNDWGVPVIKLEAPAQVNESPTAPVSPPDVGSHLLPDPELSSRIEAALHGRKIQDVLVMENARLSAERLFDPITGLFNRRYIMIRIEEEVRRSSRHAYPLSCLILDIDKFDAVNEEWGNHTGDSVLRDMAHIVTRTLRATDIVARYRDDQFIALLTDTDPGGAQVAGNRLRDAVAEHEFANPEGGSPIRITASVGVSYWQPPSRAEEGLWEPQLIALAERALKAAKQSGSNRLVMLQAA